ncbi:MAG: ergothioneine biosynthesis protein EgtB [Actinomycetota bacterium]
MTTELAVAPGRLTGAAHRYASVRTFTEALAAPLSPEDQTVQSMPDVSPTKWHRAHTTWFFEEFVLQRYARGYSPFHPQFGYLFNSYYETVGPRYPRPNRGLLTRPGAEEIGEYRRCVDEAMYDFLQGSVPDDVATLVELGLHHEQQHQELLLMDIKHVLSRNPLRPPYREARRAAPSATGPAEFVAHAGGLVEIGHAGDDFAFDNESPRHSVYLDPFAIADRPVSCGDWLAFIDDGGYRRPELWLSDGWATVQVERWDAPLYWTRDERTHWRLFTLAGLEDLDPGEPVSHVSYFEADAFARWSGARLPTEAEWEAIAAPRPVEGNFLDLDMGHPLHPAPRPPSAEPGPSALFGDVWEWTGSAYLPYPGFRPVAGAVGEYNGKFMVNQHVLRGGSCVTPPGHARATYRNFFPPSARWPFTGLRLARDA